VKPTYFWYAGFAVCALVIFYARWEIFKYYEDKSSLAAFAGRTSVVAGTVADDPDKRATSLRVTLSVATINGQATHGKLLAILPRESTASYGDTLEVRGLMELPQTFETDTGRVFDYPGYLEVRGISAVMERAMVREQHPAGFTVLGTLFALKHRFEDALEQGIAEPEVSLLEGMLLGERGGFDDALLHAFVLVGLIHIVVLSGSNIAIVAEGAFRLLGLVRMPRRLLYVLGFVAIVLFALMTGGGAATLRAVIMGGIAIVARYLHRPQAAMRALFVAAVLMVLWNPLVLVDDNGFILSVLATFGLIALAPYIEQKLTKLPAWAHFNLRSIVATTLAVEIFILPALLYTSGYLSLVSVPANALILPLVPLVMFVGTMAGVLGLLHPWLAFVPALAAQFLLKIILLITQSAAALPFAAATVAPFPAWVAIVVYVPLTFVALRIYFRSPPSLSS
jgi:competence protein ComEC